MASRVPGSVWLVTKSVGDLVAKGEILAVVDAADKIDESNELNNVGSVEIDLSDSGQADLTYSSLVLTDNMLEYGEGLQYQATVTNQGTAEGRAKTEYFLSEDDVLDANDLRLKSDTHGTLDAGESDSGSLRTVSYKKIAYTLADGDGYLLAVVDRSDRVNESDELGKVEHVAAPKQIPLLVDILRLA